ncbi:MAG: beta-phosphoglucomutase family hydrolase [Elusimicrobia bacterium]|nr:MAG: beta-phosphoglucomutase family hydrolase [Elusimicrobiota bacterium]
MRIGNLHNQYVPAPKAFLFDMDGVVCHNMPAHEEAWRRFFRTHGIEIDLKDFRENTMGMPTREVLRYYFKRDVPAEEAQALSQVKERLYRRLYGPKRRAMPGMRAFLREARRRGCRMGLGTGSKDDNVTFILDGMRLRSSFDAVVDGGMVTKGKPDPETWLILADKLGVKPKDCVVFEDSLLGEEAARRAGMAVVGVTTSHRADEFRHARLRVRDFRTLTVRRALRLS